MCRVVFPPFSRCLSSLWRALLIYSGEVFKFDFPGTRNAPNCIPTADAMHWALPIGDRASGFPPDSTEDGTFANAQPLSPTDPYITALARDLPRAKSVVQYIHVSALLAGTREEQQRPAMANMLLVQLFRSFRMACSKDDTADLLARQFNSRANMQRHLSRWLEN